MNRIRNFLPLVALLVGAAMLAAPAKARATFAVEVFDDGDGVAGTATVTLIDSTDWSISATTTDFHLAGTATIQLAGNGQLHVSYNDQVTTLTSGTHTLTLLVTNQGYTLPTGSKVLLTSAGGGSYTGASGGANTVVGNTLGFLDSSNALFGNGLGGTVSVAAPSGVVTPNSSSTPKSTTGTVTGNGMAESLVYTPPTASNVVVSAVPFSLTNVSYFTFTGAIGDVANISNSVDTATVPAPDGTVLALSAIPFLGLGAWLRRRRQAAAV